MKNKNIFVTKNALKNLLREMLEPPKRNRRKSLTLKEVDDNENLPSKFSDRQGMLRDLDEDEPGWDAIDPANINAIKKGIHATAAKNFKPPTDWENISLRKQPREPEFWEHPDYKPESAEPPGGYDNPMTLDQIAKVAGDGELNTNSAVKQFLQDPRRFNLMDKVNWLIQMGPSERNRRILQTAAEFLDKIEGQLTTSVKNLKTQDPVYSEEGSASLYRDPKKSADKGTISLDPSDPAVKAGIEMYINELIEDGAIDTTEAVDLRGRSDVIVTLDSFKQFLFQAFDDDIDLLIKFHPFRDFLTHRWGEEMRKNPELRAAVEKRAADDIARVQAKKASKNME